MLAMEIQEGKDAMNGKAFSATLGSGTASLLRLTSNYMGQHHIVVADSAFASVKSASALHSNRGMGFIGLVKTATRLFPKSYLSEHPLPTRGAHVTLQATVQPQLGAPAGSSPTNVMAVAWNDNKRKLIIASAGVSAEGPPALKDRWRFPVGAEVPRDNGLFYFKKEVPRPHVVKDYFDNANAIDVHNHYRQGALAMEQAWSTKTWWHRLFASATLYGMCVTDAFLAFQHFHPTQEGRNISFREFCAAIAGVQHRRAAEGCGHSSPLQR